MALRDAGAGLSGLDYLRAVFETKLPPPPIAATLDFTGAEVEEGRAVVVGRPGRPTAAAQVERRGQRGEGDDGSRVGDGQPERRNVCPGKTGA